MQIQRLRDLVLVDEPTMKVVWAIGQALQGCDLVQNCVQLLLAFGDNGEDALVFVYGDRLIVIGELGVGGFKVWNLAIVNNTPCNLVIHTINCDGTS